MVKRTATASGLNKRTASVKRRRVSTYTKAKYQRPTAKNQRSQIMANARVIARVDRIMRASRIWTDYQQVVEGSAINDTWIAVALTNCASWTPVLRKSDIVERQAKTWYDRCAINMRYLLNDSDFVQYTVFVVTLRQNAASRDLVTVPPNFATGEWTAGIDLQNVRLNPAVFKVHFARDVTLTANTLGGSNPTGPTGGPLAGNPATTWRKGQINLKTKFSMRQPTDTDRWRTLTALDQPYWRRYYLLVHSIVQNTGTPILNAKVNIDALHTCINSD